MFKKECGFLNEVYFLLLKKKKCVHVCVCTHVQVCIQTTCFTMDKATYHAWSSSVCPILARRLWDVVHQMQLMCLGSLPRHESTLFHSKTMTRCPGDSGLVPWLGGGGNGASTSSREKKLNRSIFFNILTEETSTDSKADLASLDSSFISTNQSGHFP